jgi:hypothetical protein
MHTRTAVTRGIVLAVATAALAAGIAKLDGTALATAESRARTALSPIADGAPIVERAHAFTVTFAGTPVEVLPVRYAPRDPGELRNVDRCGFVLLTPDRVQVLPTVGTGYLETLGCTGLDAIAFPDLDRDGQTEIAVIASTHAPPDRYLKTPVVVRRGPDGSFAVDERLTRALDERGGITTITALRRAAQQLSGSPAASTKKNAARSR